MDADLDDRVRVSEESRRSPTATPAATVEAMMFSLRSGLSCLADAGNRDRLRRCDDAAMKENVSRLRSWKAREVAWLPSWSDAEIAKLITVRRTLREGKA